MTDTDHYPEWNPYHVKMKGQLSVGEKLAVTIQKSSGAQLSIQPYGMKIVSGCELSRGGGSRGLFYGERLIVPTAPVDRKKLSKLRFDDGRSQM